MKRVWSSQALSVALGGSRPFSLRRTLGVSFSPSLRVISARMSLHLSRFMSICLLASACLFRVFLRPRYLSFSSMVFCREFLNYVCSTLSPSLRRGVSVSSRSLCVVSSLLVCGSACMCRFVHSLHLHYSFSPYTHTQPVTPITFTTLAVPLVYHLSSLSYICRETCYSRTARAVGMQCLVVDRG